MGLLRIVACLANEHEGDIRRRLGRVFGLFARDASDERRVPGSVVLTGTVYVITTWRTGKGEEDFLQILKRHHIRTKEIIRLNWLRYESAALAHALSSNAERFRSGDIVAIVRGGGDTKHRQFDPFRDYGACLQLEQLTRGGVLVVTGIGHATDHFPVEEIATFRRATPTDAAYKVCKLLKREEPLTMR